jgi:hypothetical protein
MINHIDAMSRFADHRDATYRAAGQSGCTRLLAALGIDTHRRWRPGSPALQR